MSRRRKGRHVNGVVLLDKPAGITSNHALQSVRRLFDARKGGHTGTLDPFATGMLPICLGEATKTTAFMLDADKAYRAEAMLGEATSSGDLDGEVTERGQVPSLETTVIRSVLADFIGEIEQVPPMVSALKHQGRRLYELAREGIEVERRPRIVTILDCRLVAWSAPLLTFEVHCTKGTYIRTLAEDIARRLGTFAHLRALRRLWVAPFEGGGMVSMDALVDASHAGELERHLLPADAGLAHWPVVVLGPEDATAFRHGNPTTAPGLAPGRVRVHAGTGALLGLGECDGGLLRPRRVFVAPPA